MKSTNKVYDQPIPITGLNYGTTVVKEILHFTGGVRAHKNNGGWCIGPILRNGGIYYIGKMRDDEISSLGNAMGLTLFGANQISGFDTPLPLQIWTPLLGLPRLANPASDTWGMISSQAHLEGDNDYVGVASNINLSLRAAGLQLRNASDEYHKQLLAALNSGQAVNKHFSNIAICDLHLTFHSALAEMASARDYLAQIAAHRIGAPDKVDALARLIKWLEKPANSAVKQDRLVSHLLDACNSQGTDPWLHDMTEYRNQFLHKKHIGMTAKWLMLEEQQSPIGTVLTLKMMINTSPTSETMCDALARFVNLYAKLCRLADFTATFAPYAAAPRLFAETSR